jgi:hypothetical protein
LPDSWQFRTIFQPFTVVNDKQIRGHGHIGFLLWMLLTALAQAQPMADHNARFLAAATSPQVRAPAEI